MRRCVASPAPAVRRPAPVNVRPAPRMAIAQPRPNRAPVPIRSAPSSRGFASASVCRPSFQELAPATSMGLFGGMAVAAVALALWNEAEAEERKEKELVPPGPDASAEAKASWRHEIIGRYENRLREFSTPEKVFQYFASVNKNGERFMTPMDFLRAITPFDYRASTPVGSGGAGLLSMGGLTAHTRQLDVPTIFKLADVNGDGLISFGEYVFFTTLLAIPQHHIKLAFRMFDENGDGEVDQQEFKRVMNVLRGATPLVQRSSTAGNSHEVDATGLFPVFFGADGRKKLKSTEFQQFVRQLHDGIMELEFKSFDAKNTGTISAHDFAVSIASFGRVAHLTAYLKRIDELSSNTQRISFKQFATFNRVMTHLDEVHTAMNLASRNGCTRDEFKRAALIGTGEKLDDTTVDVVFALFDKNKDGRLDPSEFYEILHSRQTRGLHSARDTGIVGFAKCTKDCFDVNILRKEV